MALITEVGEPVLWAVLNSLYQANTKTTWIQRGNSCYTVHMLTTGDIAFNERENQDLFDSRSLSNSRPASYTKLDGSV